MNHLYHIHLIFPHLQSHHIEYRSQSLTICEEKVYIGKWLRIYFSAVIKLIDNTPKNCIGECSVASAPKRPKPLEFPCKAQHYFFSFYSRLERLYVYIGKFTVNVDQIFIPINEVEHNEILIKCRRQVIQKTFASIANYDGKFCKIDRAKNRKLGHVVHSLYEWRIKKKENTSLSLIESAEGVDIPKKSMDTYLQELRDGVSNGFDFDYHRDEPISSLKSFNRKCEMIKKLPTHYTGVGSGVC